MSRNSNGVSIELYKLNEYSFPDVSIYLYRFFKSFELDYDIDRLVGDEDLFLSWVMNIGLSEGADLAKATVELNGMVYGAIYPITRYDDGLYLPIPQLARVKRIYLVYNNAPLLDKLVLNSAIESSGILSHDFSNEELYVFSPPIKLANKSNLKAIIMELQDSISFISIENIKKGKTIEINKKRKRRTRRRKKKRRRKLR